MIRLSAADWCFFDGSVEPERYYARLREAGIEAAEMVPPERRAAARAAGLELLNFAAPGMERGLNRRENHDEILPAVRETIREAASDGIAQVIVFSGNAEGLPEEEGLAGCTAAFEALVDDAEVAGVTLVFEMFCTMDHPGYQATSSRFGFELARRVASPSFRVLYDAYHMSRMGEDVEADVAQNLDLIAHIHLAQPPERTAPEVGGEPDLTRVVRAALDGGYGGRIGLEFRASGDRLAEAERVARAWQAGGL